MPYAPILFPNYSLYPTYLPLQWLPYMAAEAMAIDYRWVAATFLWLSCLYHFSNVRQGGSISLSITIAALWPMILWMLMIRNDGDLFGLTVESLVASYYLFTANAIKKGNLMLLMIGLCITLLSRYSIIFWVPCALAAIWMERGITPVIKICGGILATFLVIYWLPFLRHDPQIFFKGYAYHSQAAFGEWTHLNEWGRPYHLYNGLGMGSWAYRLLPYSDVHQKLAVYQKIHIVVCLLVIAGLITWYWKARHRLSLKTFLLFSLKLYLTFFYVFIQIPYKYLFLTPLMITAVLLVDAFTPNKEPAMDIPIAGS